MAAKTAVSKTRRAPATRATAGAAKPLDRPAKVATKAVVRATPGTAPTAKTSTTKTPTAKPRTMTPVPTTQATARAAGKAKPVGATKPAARLADARAAGTQAVAVSRDARTSPPLAKAARPTPMVAQASRAQASAPARKAKSAKVGARPPAARNRSAARGGTKGRVHYATPPLREVKVKELDPVARCGPDTSVEFLYRVDERLDGRAAGVHLVFFDRYGWYCVHGRGCAAVADVHQDLRAQRRSVPRLATTTRALGR